MGRSAWPFTIAGLCATDLSRTWRPVQAAHAVYLYTSTQKLLLLQQLSSSSLTMQAAAAGDRAFVDEDYASAIQQYTKVTRMAHIKMMWA